MNYNLLTIKRLTSYLTRRKQYSPWARTIPGYVRKRSSRSEQTLNNDKKTVHRFGHNATKCTTGANESNATTTSQQTTTTAAATTTTSTKLQQRRCQAHDAYKFVILDATATFINLKFNLKWSRLSAPRPQNVLGSVCVCLYVCTCWVCVSVTGVRLNQ